jgi:CRISPR system Cascade subunit CasA
MMNLLTDLVFRVRTPEGPATASLPELLALLGEDRVESLPGLQRHQEDAFHIFCCYLAGAVLVRQGEAAPRQSVAFWLKGIRTLTQQEGCEDDSAWTLIVDDPSKPAFLQPPSTDQATFDREYKPRAMTPDALDVLQTARNHDVKSTRATAINAEGWLFALVSLQTTIGYMGAKTYGISRMNSGSGSRPCVTWRHGFRFGARFLRDVKTIIEHRPTLLEPPHPYHAAGKTLLWIDAWNGTTSLPLARLDPFYIEIARRVRMVKSHGAIAAFSATSTATRIAADQMKGNVGDPWIPINRKTNGALTVSEAGLTPKLLRDLVFGDGELEPAAMQKEPQASSSGWMTASVFVRGNCTTDGFHEAAIRIPETAGFAIFGGGIQRDRLTTRSKKGLDLAKEIRSNLGSALFSLMEGGPSDINFDNRQVKDWVNSATTRFATNWSHLYFDWLWSTVDIPDDTDAIRPWFNELRQLAQGTLDRAAERAPQRHGRSYRAKTKAQGIFFGSLKKNFPHFMEVTHDEP